MSPKRVLSRQHHDRAVVKGALVNFLGSLGKVMMPVFYIFIARLYGATSLGLFVLVNVLVEMILKLTVSGFNDGVMMYVSRYLPDQDNHPRIYQVLANGFVVGGAISAVVIALAYSGILAHFPVYNKPELQELIRIMVWSIPFTMVSIVVVAATKAFVDMKWDALINGFIQPFGLALSALVFHFLGSGLPGLALGFLLTSVLMCLVSVFVFCRFFSFRKLAGAMFHFTLDWGFIRFALPQNLNMTFNTYITNLDVLMLGFFNFHPALIGFYNIGAQIIRNVRQVKLAFSGAYAPVIARLHEQGNAREMNRSFNQVTRWTMLLAFPLTILVILFQKEILKIFNPHFGVSLQHSLLYALDAKGVAALAPFVPDLGSLQFFNILVLVPVLHSIFGLSGNVVLMAGYSGWNLVNSFIIAGFNFVLNMLLIPVYGLAGAALATVCATAVLMLAQGLEVYHLVRIRFAPGQFYKPLVAFLPFLAAALWGGLALHLWYWKVLVGIASLGGYAFLLQLLGMDDDDRRLLFPWRRRAVP